jgi:hypothetical protein
MLLLLDRRRVTDIYMGRIAFKIKEALSSVTSVTFYKRASPDIPDDLHLY